jgi:hypothetical protein
MPLFQNSNTPAVYESVSLPLLIFTVISCFSPLLCFVNRFSPLFPTATTEQPDHPAAAGSRYSIRGWAAFGHNAQYNTGDRKKPLFF